MKKPVILVALFVLSVTLLSSCMDNSSPKGSSSTQPSLSKEDLIKKGEYLVTTIGCNDCHSPKKMGERGPELIQGLMLSGYPGDKPVPKVNIDVFKSGWGGMFTPDLTSFVGPWGETFAANLTPDQTGLGNWTEEQFKKALTQGKYQGIDGGRVLLPPMPWQNWTNMKDEDVKAIFAYLQSIPPVKNTVPLPIPPQTIMAGK
jgi:hypothetical protein